MSWAVSYWQWWASHPMFPVKLTHDSYNCMIRGLETAAGMCSHPQQDALTRRMAGIHVNLVPTG